MSNYTPIVLYGPKDSLSHGDPNKLIKGVQLDAEFSSIASAISSKLDTSSFTTSSGTFVVTATGFTGSVTGTCSYQTLNNQVTIYFPALSGTSNSTTFTITGLPPALQMIANSQNIQVAGSIYNGTAFAGGNLVFAPASGTISVFRDPTGTNAWLSSGTKGIIATTVTYVRT